MFVESEDNTKIKTGHIAKFLIFAAIARETLVLDKTSCLFTLAETLTQHFL